MNEIASFRAALVYRIVAGLGLASVLTTAACGDDAQHGGSGGGDPTGGAGGAGSATSSASGTASSGATTSSSSGATSSSSAASSSSGMVTPNVERCFTVAAGTECPSLDAAPAMFGSCTSTNEPIVMWLSGPTAMGTDCCYQVDVGEP